MHQHIVNQYLADVMSPYFELRTTLVGVDVKPSIRDNFGLKSVSNGPLVWSGLRTAIRWWTLGRPLHHNGAQVPKWEQKCGRVPPHIAFSPSYLPSLPSFPSCLTLVPLKHTKPARYTNKSAPLAPKLLWTTTIWFLAKHFFPVRRQPAGCCCLIFLFFFLFTFEILRALVAKTLL